MRLTPVRIALLVVVFAAALAAALFVLQSRESGESGRRGSDETPGSGPAATSDIWKVGDTWTITVRQDAGAISPDGDASVAEVPFRFKVTDAPETADGTWKLRVDQDGAEGPFASGWRLEYREQDGKMTLHRVAVGSEPPLEAELASIVLGPQFPYETTYEAAPKDATVDAKELLDRTALPPSSLPGQDAPDAGATPPAEAPRVEAGGTPPGAPDA